ncbi:MAG: DNA gyrase C-terminal beta-propeller domain-containing protein [Persicimonas sp.]
MDHDDLIERILDIARRESADNLLETSAATLHGELYETASVEFGGWDAALAAALSEAVSQSRSRSRRSTSRSSGSRSAEEDVHREVTEAASHPLFALTTAGSFYEVPGPDVPVTDEPVIPPTEHGTGRIERLEYLGEPSGVLVFSERGHYFGIDARMVPKWDGEMLNRRVQDVVNLEEGERVVDALPREAFYAGRIIHITRQAKGKASDISEISYTLDRQPREAFLLNDGDAPVAVLAGPEQNTVFCASAQGKAIHFEADELRSMGLKAVGVNVMKLEDDDDAVVAAFLGASPLMGGRVEQIALITEQGMAKRVDFDEFRTQGRAGAGLQLLRLDKGDRVAAAVACQAGGDLAVTTSNGRLHRMPATDFALMGRPAKGNCALELHDDERVIGLSALPCGSE